MTVITRVHGSVTETSRAKIDEFDLTPRFSAPGAKELNPRFSFLNPRFSFLNPRFSFLNPRFSFLNPRFSFLNPWFSFLDPRFSFLDSRFSFLDPGSSYRRRTKTRHQATVPPCSRICCAM